MTELEINKEYTYPQICEIVGWEQKAGNSKKHSLGKLKMLTNITIQRIRKHINQKNHIYLLEKSVI